MTTTVTTSGGTLFRLALDHYGDATQWWRIAQANGLRDPMISGTVTLNVPTLTPTDSGGILDPRR